MRKIWLVFSNEYRHHVFRKRFLLVLLSVPGFIALMVVVGLVIAYVETDTRPIGYVDHSGFFTNLIVEPEDDDSLFNASQILAYSDEDAARAALEAKQIQAYYIVSQDYLETGGVKEVALESSSSSARGDFSNFLRRNLLKDQPESIRQRLTKGSVMTTISLDESRRTTGKNIWAYILPIAVAFLFLVVINTSGGYLLQAVVDEKENRTMEIVITSVSPLQLMIGKVFGNLCVGLTQLLTWVALPMVVLLVAETMIPSLQLTQIGGGYFVLLLLTLLPAFVLVASIMATLGATVTESREAQSIAGLFTLPAIAPIFFISSIITDPNGPLAVGLSFFPLTTPVALPLRAVYTTLPFWQIALNLFVLVASAAGALWLAGRLFRIGMLRYGQRVSLREIFNKGA